MAEEKRGRGRPAFKPTATQRREVEELISCGMKRDDIARAIGISPNTLEKHFPEELATGASRKRAEVIRMLYRNARGGNVSAQRKLEEMTARAGLEADFNEPAPRKQGKKEAAAEAALTAGQGSDWGSDLAFDQKPN
jgi:hypothetical protein